MVKDFIFNHYPELTGGVLLFLSLIWMIKEFMRIRRDSKRRYGKDWFKRLNGNWD